MINNRGGASSTYKAKCARNGYNYDNFKLKNGFYVQVFLTVCYFLVVVRCLVSFAGFIFLVSGLLIFRKRAAYFTYKRPAYFKRAAYKRAAYLSGLLISSPLIKANPVSSPLISMNL